jgi:hypothetical protein
MHQRQADAPAATTAGLHEPTAGTTAGLESAYGRAAGAGTEAERQFLLAGNRIRIRASSPELLAQLSEAFAHLPAPSSDPDDSPDDLTVFLWDSAAAPGATPQLPVTDPGEPRGAVYYSASAQLQIAYQPGLGQLSVLDSSRNAAWFWCRDARELPFWEPAAPIRQILHWWLGQHGLMLLHGAAVGTAGAGALLVGRGGSGKSTSALASLDSNLLYAGDDYVAVGLPPDPHVYSIYGSGKLVPQHARLLPHLPPPSFPGDGSPEEKAVFFVSDRFPDRMCTGFPLRAVIAPRVTRGKAAITRLEPAAALRALAPSTLLQLHPASPGALKSMAALVNTVPTFSLETGEDVAAIPPTLERLLEDLSA